MTAEGRPRLLVTGSTGVLGAAFVALAHEWPEHEFVFVSRRDIDLTDAAAVRGFVGRERIRRIIHLAAISGGIDLGRRYPARILRDNVAMTFAVLDAAVAHRLDKVVLALSSGMYPVDAPQPNVESQLHDGRPHESAYSYAMAKRLMEPAIRAYRAEHALDVVGAVPSGIYGPDDNYNDDDCTWIAGLVRRFCEWTPATCRSGATACRCARSPMRPTWRAPSCGASPTTPRRTFLTSAAVRPSASATWRRCLRKSAACRPTVCASTRRARAASTGASPTIRRS